MFKLNKFQVGFVNEFGPLDNGKVLILDLKGMTFLYLLPWNVSLRTEFPAFSSWKPNTSRLFSNFAFSECKSGKDEQRRLKHQICRNCYLIAEQTLSVHSNQFLEWTNLDYLFIYLQGFITLIANLFALV